MQVTNAPASRCHCPPSLDAEAVRPALVEPIPVVITDLKVINNIFIDRVQINYIQNDYLTSNTFYRTTSGDLKSGLAWISNGQKEVGLQMVWIPNGI